MTSNFEFLDTTRAGAKGREKPTTLTMEVSAANSLFPGRGKGARAIMTSSSWVLKLAVIVVGMFLLGIVHSVIRLPEHTPLVQSRFLHHVSNFRSGLRNGSDKLGSESSVQGFTSLSQNRRGGETADFPSTTPEATWPVSVSPDTEEYEDIIHPGNPDGVMSVPRFWSDPVHNDRLMSRDLAMRIGTCATADPSGNRARGADCPQDERTIFVSLASYRDYHCRITLESVFARATHPERIRVAVVDQIKSDDLPCEIPTTPCNRDPKQMLCKHRDRIDVYTMDAKLAVGPVFARHINNRFYRGEYYAMQMDAQVIFAANWDRDIIQQHEITKDEMAVLSSSLTDIVGAIDEKTGESLPRTRPVVCQTHYFDKGDIMHLDTGTQPNANPIDFGVPELQPFWSAGFSFARGHFLVNVPYDQYQPMIFSGEQISVAIRAFTIGYDFFSLGKSVCFHYDRTGVHKEERKKVPLFWENEENYLSIDKELSENAMKRLVGIIDMSDLNVHAWNQVGKEKYGTGKARATSKFFDTFGINAAEKTHEHNLCDFVKTGEMHRLFIRHLRADGMGVDYGKINYRFKDPYG